MTEKYDLTRREVSKLGLTAAAAFLAGPTSSLDKKECKDAEIILEETDLNTDWGNQYTLDIEGADSSVGIYDNGERIDVFESGSKFILRPGEYKLKLEDEGCSYSQDVVVED